MKTFVEHLTERNYQNKTIGLIEETDPGLHMAGQSDDRNV